MLFLSRRTLRLRLLEALSPELLRDGAHLGLECLNCGDDCGAPVRRDGRRPRRHLGHDAEQVSQQARVVEPALRPPEDRCQRHVVPVDAAPHEQHLPEAACVRPVQADDVLHDAAQAPCGRVDQDDVVEDRRVGHGERPAQPLRLVPHLVGLRRIVRPSTPEVDDLAGARDLDARDDDEPGVQSGGPQSPGRDETVLAALLQVRLSVTPAHDPAAQDVVHELAVRKVRGDLTRQVMLVALRLAPLHDDLHLLDSSDPLVSDAAPRGAARGVLVAFDLDGPARLALGKPVADSAFRLVGDHLLRRLEVCRRRDDRHEQLLLTGLVGAGRELLAAPRSGEHSAEGIAAVGDQCWRREQDG